MQHIDKICAVDLELLLGALDERDVRGRSPCEKVVEAGRFWRHSLRVALRHDLNLHTKCEDNAAVLEWWQLQRPIHEDRMKRIDQRKSCEAPYHQRECPLPPLSAQLRRWPPFLHSNQRPRVLHCAPPAPAVCAAPFPDHKSKKTTL